MTTLNQQLDNELKQLVGFAADQPQPVDLSGPDGIQMTVEFTAVDRLSCAFREIRLRVPTLDGASAETLKQWAEELCDRVNYLLENIGPLEVDPQSGQVLVRSTPPDQQPDGSQFYEILLQSHADGHFSLRRYLAVKGQPGRQQVDIQATHEVLHKLVTDLVETIPSV